MFDHISKHLQQGHQKYPTVHRISFPFLNVWKCHQTWSFMFDVLHKKYEYTVAQNKQTIFSISHGEQIDQRGKKEHDIKRNIPITAIKTLCH